MWNLFVILAFVSFEVSGEGSCKKDTKNSNEVEQCEGDKIIHKNEVKMIEIAENVLMPEIGYGTWKVVGDEPIYKVP